MKLATLAFFSQLFWALQGLKVRSYPKHTTDDKGAKRLGQRRKFERVVANGSHSLVHMGQHHQTVRDQWCIEIGDSMCSEMPDACQIIDECLKCAFCKNQPKPPKPPVITYKSLRYTGPRLVIGKAKEFVERVRGGQAGRGYCQKNVNALNYKNQWTCHSNAGTIRNIGFDITIEFEEKYGSMWHFNMGVDFGLGGVVLVDGEKVKSYGGDVWWAHNANHPNHLGFGYFFPKGRHKLELVGAEGCCDGPSEIKFCANCETPTGMELVSIENLEKAFAHNIEVGEFKVEHEWAEVKFMLPFANKPVVILLVNEPSENPVSARLVEVTQTGFWCFLGKPGSNDVSLPLKVTYMAMEKGVINLPDGRAMEAGIVEGMGMTKDSHTISFSHDFGSDPPALATLMQTANGGEERFTRVATEQLDPSGVTISLEMMGGESASFADDEEVGWIAIGQGYGKFPARDTEASDKQVSYSAKLYSMACGSKTGEFAPVFEDRPLVVGSRIAPKDGGWLKFDEATKSSATVTVVDEPCLADSSKILSLIAFSGDFFA